MYASRGIDAKYSCFPQGITKVDLVTKEESSWIGNPREFVGEIIFVSRKHDESYSSAEEDEDDGYLMSYLNDTSDNSTYLVIFDAKNISQGPISKVLLPVAVPFALHGCFASGVTFDFEHVRGNFKP